ncbi:MAG: translation initiation factor IF-3 [Gammaproteobacteria bacterium]|nr:translation initiation factor IF-3 [Gammaproteobacteria bacterium]MCW5584118.1 translation initiation factor IF-3 [Gammaproteobacteria bacterium]
MSTEKKPRVNDEIRSHEVRVIDAEGQQLGVISIHEAKKISEEAGLDLVEVSPEAKPPVCRIMDYGKYKFQMSKRKAAAKKKQKQIQIKEIKLRPATEEADYQVKLRSIMKFLENGDKSKVTVRFRGREMSHPELGMQLLGRMLKDLVDYSVVEQHPKFEGRQIVMVLGPKKK